MKDSEIQGEHRALRGEIRALSEIVSDLRHRIEKTGELLVQDCETCGHETMQIRRRDYGIAEGSSIGYAGPYMPVADCPPITYYVCLGCGNKFRLFPTNRFESYVPSTEAAEHESR